MIPTFQFACGGTVNVAWREDVNGDACCLQSLHFTGNPDASICALAPVERADANGVSGDAEVAVAFIPDDASEDAIEAVPEFVGVSVFLV